MRKAFQILILLFSSFISTPASAWGPVGHETIAYIAWDNLNSDAQAKIKALLEPGSNLPSISNWADEIRPTHKETAPWHYIDLPIRKDITKADEAAYCPDNNCILNQLQIFEDILGEYSNDDYSKSKADRLKALKFIVHFMGDLHQPLHCADDSDRGGNQKTVLFWAPWGDDSGKPHRIELKLHALWDDLLVPDIKEDPRQMATNLEKEITAGDREAWMKGDTQDWIFESYTIAKNKIYPGFEPGDQSHSSHVLPKDYYEKMRPVVCKQLEKAGIRLAFVLEEVLK